MTLTDHKTLMDADKWFNAPRQDFWQVSTQEGGAKQEIIAARHALGTD